MARTRLAAVIGTAAFTAAGLGAGAAITACGSTGQAAVSAAAIAAAPSQSRQSCAHSEGG
jgi:hypothetical protein